MHDLNTIRRLNAEAHAESINTARAAGKHVVAEFAGLHLMTTYAFDDVADALAALKAPAEAGDSRAYFPPVPAHHAARRDQSEDRGQPFTLDQLAALGRRSVGDPEADFAAVAA
jgi:hypothetical protein